MLAARSVITWTAAITSTRSGEGEGPHWPTRAGRFLRRWLMVLLGIPRAGSYAEAWSFCLELVGTTHPTVTSTKARDTDGLLPRCSGALLSRFRRQTRSLAVPGTRQNSFRLRDHIPRRREISRLQ